MATWIGIAIGVVFAAAGWAFYVYAPKVGPNPIFGVRTWYSMVSVEVWDQSNRTGGIVFALIGGLIVLSTLIAWPWINPNSDAGILTVVGITLAITAVGITWLVFYTRRLSKGVPIVGAGVLRVSPLWLVPATILTIALAGFLVATNASLPAESVATHFDANGVANDWMGRSGHFWLSIGTAVGVFAFLAALFLILTHVAIPGVKTWPIAGEPVMHFLAGMLMVVEAIMGMVYFDIFWFNTREEHALSPGMFVSLVLGVALVGTAVGITYIIVYGRRLRTRRL